MDSHELASIIKSEWEILAVNLEGTKLEGLALEMPMDSALEKAETLLNAVSSAKGTANKEDVLAWFVGYYLRQVVREVVIGNIERGEVNE